MNNPFIKLLFFLSINFTTLSFSSTLTHNFKLDRSLKVLHLTFHRGCALEFSRVAKELGIEVDTWYIHDLPRGFFEGTFSGSAVYNLGHDRAQRIWDLHHETFLAYDLILTSDTVPLSRIFLQNNFHKPLVIWMCNRFDYYDGASLDCDFPDQEYFNLLKNAPSLPNVKIVAYNEFEHYYAKKKGIDTGDLTITPCAPTVSPENIDPDFVSIIPKDIDKKNTFFLPPYHNETIYMNFQNFLEDLNIPSYCGRYNGPYDLLDFKGIICMPYAWSNLALFENIALGLPYFIPSEKFLNKLMKKPNYFFVNYDKNGLCHSEWYCPKHKEIFTYFDSWADLQAKVESLDYEIQRQKTLNYSKELQVAVLSNWHDLLSEFIYD